MFAKTKFQICLGLRANARHASWGRWEVGIRWGSLVGGKDAGWLAASCLAEPPPSALRRPQKSVGYICHSAMAAALQVLGGRACAEDGGSLLGPWFLFKTPPPGVTPLIYPLPPPWEHKRPWPTSPCAKIRTWCRAVLCSNRSPSVPPLVVEPSPPPPAPPPSKLRCRVWRSPLPSGGESLTFEGSQHRTLRELQEGEPDGSAANRPTG